MEVIPRMARFSDFDIGLPAPEFRDGNIAMDRFVRAVRWGLAGARLEAPWRKLFVRLLAAQDQARAFSAPVEGVMGIYVPADLERLRRLTPATGIQFAADRTREALAVLRSTVDWDDRAFLAIVEAVAAHEGPFVRYPAPLTIERRAGAYRIAIELDEHGSRVLLDHRPKGASDWLRAVVREFPGAWEFAIDYDPHHLRVNPAGIDLLNSLGRVLDRVPHPDQAKERWTTRPSGA